MRLKLIMGLILGLLTFYLNASTPSVPRLVKNEAAFWLDASNLTVGDELTSWRDVRGEGFPVASSYDGISQLPQVVEIASGDLAGKKAVDFFSIGTQCDLKFGESYCVKTVFFVVDVEQVQHAFLLGGPKGGENTSGGHDYAFHRGGSGEYKYGYAPNCDYWNNGLKVDNPGGTRIPTGYQLITYRYIDTGDGAAVRNLTRDRGEGNRVGGKRLCEIIAFKRALGDDEIAEVEKYLYAKWFSLDGIISKARVHFDASVADSFVYDTEDPTKVVGWNDLSVNENHFARGQVVVKNEANADVLVPANYGTVSTIGGRPVYDSGVAGSGIDLRLSERLPNTRTVIMVAEVERHGDVFFLGDTNEFRFHRGGGGGYTYGHDAVHIREVKGGQIWCNGVRVSDGYYPEIAGSLSVYVFTATSNLEWCNLGQDRMGAYRNGGKRVAELLSFDYKLSNYELDAIYRHLKNKWRPTNEYLASLISNSAVSVDASNASNFIYNGGDIVGWKNNGTIGDLTKPDSATSGAYGFTNGVPAFLMGKTDNNVDLRFAKITNLRSVFWVMDVERSPNCFFLGDDEAYHYYRGSEGKFGYNNTGAITKDGAYTWDGNKVSNPLDVKTPYGLHVYGFGAVKNAEAFDTTASSLAKDRTTGGRNGGGRAISELLLFTETISGLTRIAIQDDLQKKWVSGCGWAKEGSAEWGVSNYRVFDGDVTIPEGGADALGIGFKSNAVVSGGVLTLGEAGLFASEGAEVTINTQIRGMLGVYGPGCVTLNGSSDSFDVIRLGYGSKLVCSTADDIAVGTLSLQENSKLIVDMSGLTTDDYIKISFSELVLPAGGALEDYVSIEGGAGHVLLVEGNAIHVNYSLTPITARWTGSVDADVKNPQNWVCQNQKGDDLPNTVLPGITTTSITLEADCDLSNWGESVFADGVSFELNGNTLKIANLDSQSYPNAKFTNSNGDVTSELHVIVAEGRKVNETAKINGNIRLVKYGTGTFVQAFGGQGYTGGTVIKEGVFENGSLLTNASSHSLGANNNTITVSRNGDNIGIFDMKGLYNQKDVGYVYVGDGGIFRNTNTDDRSQDWGQLREIRLTADSQYTVGNSCGLRSNTGVVEDNTIIQLSGRNLTFDIAGNKVFHIIKTQISEGTLTTTGAGSFQIGYYTSNSEHIYPIDAQDTDFVVGSSLRVLAPLTVRNYTAMYEGDLNEGTNRLFVTGTFKPCVSDRFYGCTLGNGSVLDLSALTGEFSLTSAFTAGLNTVTFADDAIINVALGNRADLKEVVASSTPIIRWTNETAPSSRVTFNLSSEIAKAGYLLTRKSDGMYLIRNGFKVIVR